MKSHIINFRVRYAETDQMGVVHHGNYAKFLEMGRIEWLRNLGFSYKEMEDFNESDTSIENNINLIDDYQLIESTNIINDFIVLEKEIILSSVK